MLRFAAPVAVILVLAAPRAAPAAEAPLETSRLAAPPELPPVTCPSRERRRFDALLRAAAGPADPALRLAAARRAHRLYERLDASDAVVRLAERLERERGIDPELLGWVRFTAVQAERRAGRFDKARAWAEKLGFVTDFAVAGPFDLTEAGIDAPLEPESGFNAAARYEGRGREVGWRRIPALDPLGVTALYEVLEPDEETIAFALTTLVAERAGDVLLRIGSAGPTDVFVNGDRVYAGRSVRDMRFDQDAVRVTLKAGANPLLVKTGRKEGGLAFRLRVTALDGRSDPRVRADAAAGTLARVAARPLTAGRDRIRPVPGLLDRARRAAEASETDGRAALVYAWLLTLTQNFDRERSTDREWAETAVNRLTESAGTDGLWTKLEALQLLAELRSDSEADADLAYAARIAPDDADVLLARARAALRRGLRPQAVPLLLAAVRADPSFEDARLELIELYRSQGLYPLVADLAAELARCGETSRNLVLRARAAGLNDRPDRARALYGAALELRADDTGLYRMLAENALGRMEGEEALGFVERGLRIDPYNRLLASDRIRILKGLERVDEALKALNDLADLDPGDATIRREIGDLLHRTGKTDDARAAWRASLDLRPNQPDLEAYLAFLSPASERFEKPYIADTEALLREIAPTTDPDADGEFVISNEVVRVFENGTASRFGQQVFRITTKRGTRAAQYYPIRFVPSLQRVEVLLARVIRADGTIEQAQRSIVQDLSQGDKIFYDYAQQVVPFGNLEPGDSVEVRYKIHDTGDNIFKDYFGTLESVALNAPVRRFRFVVQHPVSRNVRHEQTSGVAAPRVTEAAGVRMLDWQATDIEAFRGEPDAPAYPEVGPYIHVSTRPDWQNLGDWYRDLVREQFKAGPSIKQLVRELTKGARTDREKLQRIHAWVVQKTRYIGLEFGIHGFKPYPVNQVFSRRFGDCKDKAMLLVVMLAEAGIDARFVLIRTRNVGRLQGSMASLAVFNHAIAYVPAFDLYLDGTAEFSGLDELPWQDRGAQALILGLSLTGADPGPHRFLETPEAVPEQAVQTNTFTGRLEADGTLRVQARSVMRGSRAAYTRQLLQDAGRRRDVFQRLWNDVHPGTQVAGLTTNDFGNLAEEPVCTYELVVPDAARARDGALLLPPALGLPDFAQRYGGLSERKLPFFNPTPWRGLTDLTIALPPGARAEALPAPIDLNAPYGRLQLTVRAHTEKPDTLIVQLAVDVTARQVPAAEYPAFRGFWMEVQQALTRPIVIAVPGARPSPAAPAQRTEYAPSTVAADGTPR